MAYSEILDDERKETAAGFWERANTFFAGIGVTVTAVMTDNGSCYRSRAFAAALGKDVKHRRTRAYRPQTNGKVERFNRTLAAEWAYAKVFTSEQERAAAYDAWLHHYNHHRPHTGIGGQVPSDRVHNLTGKYTARFGKVGVLRRSEIQAAADGAGKVNVIRFQDTEVLQRPISRHDEMFKRYVKGRVQSMRQVDAQMFDEVMAIQLSQGLGE